MTRKLKILVSQLDANKTTISKGRISAEPKRRLTLAMVPRQLKSGLSLLEKNVRDLPTSSYDLRPTHKQRMIAGREMSRILTACQAIAQLCATVANGPFKGKRRRVSKR